MTEPKNLRDAILDGYFNGTDYEHVKDFAEYILSVLDGSLESSTIMKNCPFCGLKMEETPDYASDYTKEVDVACHNCCVTFNFGSRKRAEAIAAWNRRQNPELAALKAAAKEALRLLKKCDCEDGDCSAERAIEALRKAVE